MKKLLIILLVVTLTIAGCGNMSTEKKEELVKLLDEMDAENFEKKVQAAKYIQVETGNYELYLKADGIKGDSITPEDMADLFDEDGEKESYYATIYSGKNYFEAVYQVNDDEGTEYYYVTIGAESVHLSIGKIDEDDQLVAFIEFEFKNGELELVEELDENDDNYAEYEKMLDEHENKAKKFFEKAFKELDTLIS